MEAYNTALRSALRFTAWTREIERSDRLREAAYVLKLLSASLRGGARVRKGCEDQRNINVYVDVTAAAGRREAAWPPSVTARRCRAGFSYGSVGGKVRH